MQVLLLFEVSRSLRHACYWLIERFGNDLAIKSTVDRLKDNMAAVYSRTGSIMSKAALERHENAAQVYIEKGVPEKLANQMSALLLTRPALDMSDLAASYKPDVIDLARLYAATNDKLGIYWLHVAAEDLKWTDRWQAVARGKLRDDFFRMRRELAEQILVAAVGVVQDVAHEHRSGEVRRCRIGELAGIGLDPLEQLGHRGRRLGCPCPPAP